MIILSISMGTRFVSTASGRSSLSAWRRRVAGQWPCLLDHEAQYGTWTTTQSSTPATLRGCPYGQAAVEEIFVDPDPPTTCIHSMAHSMLLACRPVQVPAAQYVVTGHNVGPGGSSTVAHGQQMGDGDDTAGEATNAGQ